LLLEQPRARGERVAAEVGVSERQLERRFREAVGYGPKTLQRVLRFRHVLEALDAGGREADGLSWIAAYAGYSDQAHMTRETIALSGLTPIQLEHVLATLKSQGASGVFKTGARARPSRHVGNLQDRRASPQRD
jgi:transcriptional regulator GlxA family with amidase domain